MTELQAIPAARARLDATELALIDQARRDGATWADIASALGLSSRQAAEQRRLRLANAEVQSVREDLDRAYGTGIATLRAAAVEVHRRIGADRRWAGRFTRAALVRDTLAAAPDAPPGALFALVKASMVDLDAASVPLPAPMKAAVGRLRAAVVDATPQP